MYLISTSIMPKFTVDLLFSLLFQNRSLSTGVFRLFIKEKIVEEITTRCRSVILHSIQLRKQ